VFLDEIGDMPFSLQAKILRLLQERSLERLGGRQTIPVDVRIIAATNRDLEQAIREGYFREDLYYRLSVFPIRVPPLRERREDIPDLVTFFLHKRGRKFENIDRSAVDQLMRYDWPGNVRELENVIERAVILAAEGETIGLSHLPLPSHSTPRAVSPGEELNLEKLERQSILQALQKSGGNKSAAARLLGITRRTLYSRMERLGLGDRSGD